MPLPAGNLRKLTTRPSTDGRPNRRALDVAPYRAAKGNKGRIAARCHAAIAADPVRFGGLAGLTKDGLRKAYKRGESELKRE